MNILDHFDRMLAGFNRVEEPVFLRQIREFGLRHRDIAIKTFSMLLENPQLDPQLEYLILKSTGELKYKEFISIIKNALNRAGNPRIIGEALDSLTAIGTFPAYRVIVDYLMKNTDVHLAEKIERNLNDIFNKNPLAFHFDVFYRDRGAAGGIEKSSEFLVRHLPGQYIRDLLPAIDSPNYTIRSELLRLLKERPGPMFYASILRHFEKNAGNAGQDLFLIMSDALIYNAGTSKARAKIFHQLNEHAARLPEDKKKTFYIALFKLNNSQLIQYIASRYPRMEVEEKMRVLDHLSPGEYPHTMNFVRELLLSENNETLLARVIGILVRAGELEFLFAALDTEKPLRKEKLLKMLLDHQPRSIDQHLLQYITPSQDNQILRLSLEYLLVHTADKYYELYQRIFFSGVSPEIKTLIIRHIHRWNPGNREQFMESIFKHSKAIGGFKKDFLLSLLDALNRDVFAQPLELKILEQVLVLMEESPADELAHFLYFFEHYRLEDRQHKELVVNELRLVRNTLLKSGASRDLPRRIHQLVKQIASTP
jgi:hypothetical protein